MVQIIERQCIHLAAHIYGEYDSKAWKFGCMRWTNKTYTYNLNITIIVWYENYNILMKKDSRSVFLYNENSLVSRKNKMSELKKAKAEFNIATTDHFAQTALRKFV